jgi:hypothetical protein
MNLPRILIFFTFLIVFFVNAQAQFDCSNESRKLIREPFSQFPNEVEGFKFFGEGRLGALKLGVSTARTSKKFSERRLRSLATRKLLITIQTGQLRSLILT